MALLNLTFFLVTAVYLCVEVSRSESTSTPSNGCFITETDVMFLYFDGKYYNEIYHQKALSTQFIQDLLGVHSNKTTSRVMFGDVIDIFSSLSPHVNVSSWRLQTFNGSRIYGFDERDSKNQRYKSVEETIEMKITFVERLFSEMGGVRENVTHIGVIFLDGSGLSYEESRRVPHIVQQQSTDINIFVVVMNDPCVLQSIQINVTLFINQPNYASPKHILTLAMCNQCMEGWFMFQQNDASNTISCYKLLDSDDATNWYQSSEICGEQSADLPAIETTTELNFLQTKIFSYFTDFGYFRNNTPQSTRTLSVQMFIGLQRDSQSNHKRFIWVITKSNKLTPLMINNWMSGHPSGRRSSRCVIWEVVWNDLCNDTESPYNDHCNDTASSHNDHCNDIGSSRNKKTSFLDGWVDVNCETQLCSFTMCEITFPVRINEKIFLRIKPAAKERLSRALKKGAFKDNIVSISANIASEEFLQFLKQSGIEFPVFNCGEGEDNPRYISYVYVCDHVDHCRNRRDETFCNFNKQVMTCDVNVYSRYCTGVICSDSSCLPLQFVNDGEIDCFVYGYGMEMVVHDESEIIIYKYWRNETCAFICNVNKCISLLQLNDGHTDCKGVEGPLDETIGQLEAADTCYNSLSQNVWAPRCVYFKDMFGAVLGCRDLSHLYKCADFECPEGYFKCPNTYCIPQHYVLDGKSDCPSAEDEQRDIISPCSGNFACWNSPICLHPDLVCNGHPDCPYKDDEVDCDVSCPQGLRCISGTAQVLDYNMSIAHREGNRFDKFKTFSYIDFSGTDLSILYKLYFFTIVDALVIVLSNCKLKELVFYGSLFCPMAREMDVSYNQIQNMDGRSLNNFLPTNVRYLNLSYNKELVVVKYLQMPVLETFDLSHTGLTDIDESFIGLFNLKHLNLSFTFVTEIHKNWFHSNLVLQSFDLRGLTVKNVVACMFNGLTVRQDLYTDSFELYCPQIRGINIPYYACHAPDDAISSCFDLIGVNVQRFLLWSMAVIAVVGNMAVIGYRVIWDRSVLRTGYGLFVTNLSISDFIMGVYLFIIAGSDHYYRDIYVLNDKTWRESIKCRYAGFLVTLSSETSIFFIFLFTLDRFFVMKFPYGQYKFTNLSKFAAILLSWVTGLMLSVTSIVFNFDTYSSNAVCLGLPLTTKRLLGWEFSFGVFIVFNLCLSLIIAYGQRAIYQVMSESRITGTASSSSLRRVENITIAKQLSLIAVTNFLCWFPVGLMGLFSFFDQEIRQEVYAWTTVIVLPINSAANPLLYTIPALMARWEKFKMGEASTQHNRP